MKKLMPISLLLAALLWVGLLWVFRLDRAPLAAEAEADAYGARVEQLAGEFYAVPFDNHLWVVHTGGHGYRSNSFQHHPDCYCKVLGSQGVGK